MISKSSIPGGHVLVRCDSATAADLNSVTRCLSIARQLQDQFDFDVTFALDAIDNQQAAIEVIREQDFRVKIRPSKDSESEWVIGLCTDLTITDILIDGGANLTEEAIEELQASGVIISTLDDVSDRRLSADLAIYSPTNPAKDLKWLGSEATVNSGWQWVALPHDCCPSDSNVVGEQTKSLQEAVSQLEPAQASVLVRLEGEDGQEMTWKTARRIADLLCERDKNGKDGFEVTFVLDKGIEKGRYTAMRIASLDRRFNVIGPGDANSETLGACDLAVVSFGLDAYEMAYLGMPSVLLCQNGDHSEAASAFVQAGIAKRSLVDAMGPGRTFGEQLEHWLDQSGMRREAGQKAQTLVDGGGAFRIAEAIATHTSSKAQVEAEVA